MGEPALRKTLDVIFAPHISVRVYGLAAIGFGLVGLAWGDLAAVLQPVPKGFPGRVALAYAVALACLLGGLAMQWRRSAAFGALGLTALFTLSALLFHVPRIFAHPAVFVTWEGSAEQLALVAGGLVAYSYCAHLQPASAARISRIGRLLLGACLIVFGLAHLFYLAPTAAMVPAWLPPDQTFWAYATAAGHFAAGLALLSGIAARPAAMLLTAMFVVFGILVHAPTICSDPHSHINWSENVLNFALIASAWVIAASIKTTASPGRRHEGRS